MAEPDEQCEAAVGGISIILQTNYHPQIDSVQAMYDAYLENVRINFESTITAVEFSKHVYCEESKNVRRQSDILREEEYIINTTHLYLQSDVYAFKHLFWDDLLATHMANNPHSGESNNLIRCIKKFCAVQLANFDQVVTDTDSAMAEYVRLRNFEAVFVHDIDLILKSMIRENISSTEIHKHAWARAATALNIKLRDANSQYIDISDFVVDNIISDDNLDPLKMGYALSNMNQLNGEFASFCAKLKKDLQNTPNSPNSIELQKQIQDGISETDSRIAKLVDLTTDELINFYNEWDNIIKEVTERYISKALRIADTKNN